MSPYKKTTRWWSVTGSSEPRRRWALVLPALLLPALLLMLVAMPTSLGAQTAASTDAAPADAAPADAALADAALADVAAPIEVLSSAPCGKDRQCHRLQVTCGGLAARGAEVVEYEVAASRGTVVVGTGVYGNRPYDEFQERQTTLKELATAGFEVFALRWSDGKLGWGSTAEGAGYEAPMCGFSTVVRWLAATRADRPEVLCAQGNSGAALQIAYGLSVYGLGDLLDVAVLTGGPPLTRIDQFCFDPTRQPKERLWRANGRRITDYLMGWDGDGDHCKNARGDAAAVLALQATGLLPAQLDGQLDGQPQRQRRFDFPNTHLIFLLSEGDKSLSQARFYYEAVTSSKTWHTLPGRAHGVDREPATAVEVRRQLIAACGAVESGVTPSAAH